MLTSHISSDLESICDDIYLINEGEIVLHEDTDVILGEYALLKMDAKTYEGLEKKYLMKTFKTQYGYSCFTREKQFYLDNYPTVVVENGSIDEMILMLTGGKE